MVHSHAQVQQFFSRYLKFGDFGMPGTNPTTMDLPLNDDDCWVQSAGLRGEAVPQFPFLGVKACTCTPIF